MSLFVIFDGDCGFCSRAAVFVARNDSSDRLTFVSSTSGLGLQLLKKHQLENIAEGSIVLVEGSQCFFKSGAIKKILVLLPGLKMLGVLLSVFPKPVADWGYDFIARNRREFYKNNVCKIPESSVRKKFIL